MDHLSSSASAASRHEVRAASTVLRSSDVSGSLPAHQSVGNGPHDPITLRGNAEWFGVLAAQSQARFERTGWASALEDRDRWLAAQRETLARLEDLHA
jgi:hypothetical protein